MPPEATITAWARSGNSPVALPELLLPRSTLSGSRIVPLTPSTVPLVIVSASTRWRNLKVRRPLARASRARRSNGSANPGAGAPGDMEPRHRITVAHRTVASALGPADHGEDSMAHRPEPSALLACRERHVGFRPALRPKILIAVEARRPDPVLQREIVAVLDAEPALFGRIDQE